ncbi:MAG: hypothetical protein OXE87_15985 [Chloroflexi bacterium]|nr:hypothetical protein [Chloroflexota bacterium]
MREIALYVNGIFDSVFQDILAAQTLRPHRHYYLQPYARYPIAYLRDNPPTHDDSVRLYASTSEDLQKVHYTADLIRWEDKRTIPEEKRARIFAELREFQPDEWGIVDPHDVAGDTGINLLYVTRVQQIARPFDVGELKLKSKNRPLLPREVAGGIAYVFPKTDDC